MCHMDSYSRAISQGSWGPITVSLQCSSTVHGWRHCLVQNSRLMDKLMIVVSRVKLRTSVTGLNPYSTHGFSSRRKPDLYPCHPPSVWIVSVDANPRMHGYLRIV